MLSTPRPRAGRENNPKAPSYDVPAEGRPRIVPPKLPPDPAAERAHAVCNMEAIKTSGYDSLAGLRPRLHGRGWLPAGTRVRQRRRGRLLCRGVCHGAHKGVFRLVTTK